MNRRNTKQRQAVFNAVKNRCDHPTAEQLYEDIHSVDSSISVGTMYRNLGILCQEKQISIVKLPNADRYDLRTDNHNHFVCEKCGRVFDIDIKYDENLDNQKTSDNFYIKSHQTVFKGICPDCNK